MERQRCLFRREQHFVVTGGCRAFGKVWPVQWSSFATSQTPHQMHFDCATCVNSGWRQNLWESQKQVFTYLINLMLFAYLQSTFSCPHLGLNGIWVNFRQRRLFISQFSHLNLSSTCGNVAISDRHLEAHGHRGSCRWTSRKHLELSVSTEIPTRPTPSPGLPHSGMNERRLWHVSRHVQWIFKSLIRCNWCMMFQPSRSSKRPTSKLY